ncbi:MAG: hypothetical protein IKR73_08315 [Oscillospiraceae bacterium]|nr:hypothetical protein [Oscillospiraceae bacterium]
MDTFIGSLYHLAATANRVHIIWLVAVAAAMIVSAVLHHRWKGDEGKMRRWRYIALIPALLVCAHALIYLRGAPMFVGVHLMLYLIGVLSLLPVLLSKRRIGYRIAAVFVGIVSLRYGLEYIIYAPNFFNYTRQSYTASFRSMAKDMDRLYVLKEWKDIDFAALEAKYMPMVEEAERQQDPAKFSDAVTMFCNELHDGHVSVWSDYDRNRYRSALTPRGYGLAMVQLDNGEVIAACVSDEVRALGIECGTVITKWDGKDVPAAAEDIPDIGLSVKANEDRLAVMELSGIGGDTVEVSFLDDAGREQTVILEDTGATQALNNAKDIFSREALTNENFAARMLGDRCGYLRITAEGTDDPDRDLIGYLSGDHKWAREMFREKLRDLRSQGMEELVIDLRNNSGGYDEIGCALCDLLTTEDMFGQGLGIRKDGKYICVSEHGIHGDGEFADLKVVALTNFNCISAGDGTSLYLSRLPNVTLAGITDPYGCDQETGGRCVLTDGIVTVSFPVGLILDEDGVPNIDTRADRISRNGVEVRIPFDRDAAMRMFGDGRDYELEWAVRYLENDDKGEIP